VTGEARGVAGIVQEFMDEILVKGRIALYEAKEVTLIQTHDIQAHETHRGGKERKAYLPGGNDWSCLLHRALAPSRCGRTRDHIIIRGEAAGMATRVATPVDGG
jgi:hypothetical protein